MQRLAAPPVPRDDGLALIGDADCGDRLVERAMNSVVVATTASQISIGVVLDPTRPGEVLRELAIPVARRLSRFVDGKRPHTRGSCIECDDDGHDRSR